ncbi:MAG: hypothetical protein QNJ41_03590 [Xenococcaceae cyanobacterium MO_188.B32]|nr:hypothetical protein [Xenococcaceae cyanobacterium MO_188.B32]
MKTNIVDKLVRYLPRCKNIFLKGRIIFVFLIVVANIGSVSTVLAQEIEIIECSGQVLLKRGSSEYRSTGVGERLQPGDLLFPQSGAIAKVLCADEDSDIWRVPVGIPSSIHEGCPEWNPSVVKGETRYRPGGSNLQIPYILHPRMTYLLHDRPTFRWNGVEGVTNYTVRLLGPGGLEWETEESSTEVVYPNNAPPLEWGVKYLVTVEADNVSSLQDGGGILGFELLDEDTIQEVEEKAAKIAELEDRTEEERALTLAKLYRGENLTAEAIATLEALVEQDSQTALVFRMLGDLYTEVGLNLLAEARYEKASELFASTLARYALTATQDGLARTKLMLGKMQEAERLSAQVIAEYRELGDEQSATGLEQRLAEAASEEEQPETLLRETDPSSVTQIITPSD